MKQLILFISLLLLIGVVSADTLIIYPSSLGDGEYYRSRVNVTYPALRDESSYSGAHGTTTSVSLGSLQTVVKQETDRFNTMEYGYISIDTSSILANSTITSANWSIYLSGKSDAFGDTKTLNWTSAVFANPADPGSGAYNNTFSSDVISTTLNYADFTNRVYFDITPSAINKSGYTMMVSRVNDHYANSFSGTWVANSLSFMDMFSVDHATVSVRPYMTITYDPSPIASFTPTGEITGITSVTQSFNSTSSNIESSMVFTAYNTSIIDLYAAAPAGGYTFATLRDQSVGSVANNLYTIGLVAGTTTNQFIRLTRAPLEFNTSDLPDDSSIINSYIGLTGYTAQSILLGDTNLGITGFNPTTNGSDVVGGDYSKFDSTEMVINKSYSSWNAAGWNNFNLTPAGLNRISKTGWSNFFIRSDWDIYNNFTGTWKIGSSNGTILSIRTSNYATVSERPTLTVNYFPTGTFAWGARNVTGNNTWISIGSTENITQTFGVGNWSVNLTVINQAGTANISTQVTWVNVSAAPDTTPPLSITGLTNTTATTCNSINWTYTNPTTSDFNHTYVLKNNVFYANLSNTTTYSLWTGLTESVEYTISTKTVDITGNMNATFVNASYTLPACGVAPVASFTPNVTEGTANLPVLFTDTSTGTPTAWSWFFGDETYSQAWVQQNASSGWSARSFFGSVSLSDGSIVVVGGSDGGVYNDVWRSTDKGAMWVLQNTSADWSARRGLSVVSLSDGSIVLMGGNNGLNDQNDVWRSTDKGISWTQQNASAGWTARNGLSSVALSDDSIVVMGGLDDNAVVTNDVWRSTNKGVTWVRQNASAGWTARTGHKGVVLSDGSIVLTGGTDTEYNLVNDAWRSTDKGATWTQQNASAGWSARFAHSMVSLPDSSIVLMGGTDGDVKNDVWRSTDKGAIWTLQNASADWSARSFFSSVVMPDGSIVLMGGNDGDVKNDVWRFQPSGSTEQNPTHTYAAGNWSVHLTASNAVGYNNSVQNTWINVTSGVITPIVQWILDKSTVRFPGTVTVNDTSLNTPTAWEYFWGDGTSNTTTGNATHKYLKRGVYQVTLNATNSAGVNVSASKQVRVLGYEIYY